MIIVIGRGLIGSAAARHLADAGHEVTLIGPTEPENYSGAGPFSSHYDQGRVTRITAFDEPWGEWAKASIDRYAEIEERSGISFHDPVGLVVLAHAADRAARRGAELGARTAIWTVDELFQETGIASTVPEHKIAWEAAPAGIINPRALVAAQTHCAAEAGAKLVDDVVESIDSDSSPISVTTRSGSKHRADKVLLCTGAYGASLLGLDDAFPTERRMRTIVLAEVSDGPDLPTLIIDDPAHPLLEEAYWVPPVEWPNGKHLIKIGGDSLPKQVASSNDEIDQWFNEGASTGEADALFELLTALLPTRILTRHSHRPCVVSYPAAGVPHIASVSDSIAITFGGCGASAKSSDELGRLAGLELLN